MPSNRTSSAEVSCKKASHFYCLRRVRRKNVVVLIAGACLLFYSLFELVDDDRTDMFIPLRPLSSAADEARRLLKFMSHYHYQCNSTLEAANRSYWPICTEHGVGLDLNPARQTIRRFSAGGGSGGKSESGSAPQEAGQLADGVVYVIGDPGEYAAERALALNFSYRLVLAWPDTGAPAAGGTGLPRDILANTNQTLRVRQRIVANDAADFARNSYSQRTLNDLLASTGHRHLALLKLTAPASPQSRARADWELLHYAIYDRLFSRGLRVDQLQLAVRVERLDDDYLYAWYRALYRLFDSEGFRLYHTGASHPLCLQVTMMQSCVYYLSWLRDPGVSAFVLQPPADFGDVDSETRRLVSHMRTAPAHCRKQSVGGSTSQGAVGAGESARWHVCVDYKYGLYAEPCNMVRFVNQPAEPLEHEFRKKDCAVHTFLIPSTLTPAQLNTHPIHYSRKPGFTERNGKYDSDSVYLSKLSTLIGSLEFISLMEMNVHKTQQWTLLRTVLDSGILSNVTQIVTILNVPDSLSFNGRITTLIRSAFSELKRLGRQGFLISHSELNPPTNNNNYRKISESNTNAAYKISFVNRVVR